MNYGITKLTIGFPGFVEIEEHEYSKYVQAINGLAEALYLEEKFDFVACNFLEYEEDLLSLGARHMVSPSQFFDRGHEERRAISRRIINLLSASRLFLDQSTHHLSNIYGSDSLQVDLIKEEKSKQYDKLLGYRVMEALRNHVQHRGYPIHTITYASHKVEDYVLHTVIPQMEIRYFLDDKKFKSSVLSEIKDLGQKISINRYIREFMEGLEAVQSKIRDVLIEDLMSWENLLNDIEARFKAANGSQVSLAGLAVVIENDKRYVETHSVVADIMKRRKALANKNTGFNNLSSQYVSDKT
ncbi:hypothetical protein [Candidatus Leptofilum sp.]|uniref:hypothetical protein n=1 Tax=Candidatus Leptofilum sp. TaxID=3241576 RepID=UPI003B58BD05